MPPSSQRWYWLCVSCGLKPIGLLHTHKKKPFSYPSNDNTLVAPAGTLRVTVSYTQPQRVLSDLPYGGRNLTLWGQYRDRGSWISCRYIAAMIYKPPTSICGLLFKYIYICIYILEFCSLHSQNYSKATAPGFSNSKATAPGSSK